MEYKSILEPHEWYGWKREHPDEYKIIKTYLLKRFPFCTEEHEGTTYTNLLISRRFFNFGEMFGFLSTYHYLGKYKHISYSKRPHYRGGTCTTIHID